MAEAMDESNGEIRMRGDSESDGDEEKTAAELLTDLEKAWLNEKFAPEILPHKSNHVDCLLHHISYMEENLRRLPKGDLRLSIHRMEIDRIRYLVSSYLRMRLEKIERHVIDILQRESEKSEDERYLTEAEYKFATEYAVNMETLFRSLVLQHLPPNQQGLEADKLAIRPNMSAHVFLRANKKINGVLIPGTVDEEVDFLEGSQHIIQYTAVADLVKEGAVQLI
uniref:DNA replication complex GINS protein SLD5 n=1 Tax=Bracon brevicornis TaxID=1563983 RepID=A0A6V7HNT6_9HYME